MDSTWKKTSLTDFKQTSQVERCNVWVQPQLWKQFAGQCHEVVSTIEIQKSRSVALRGGSVCAWIPSSLGSKPQFDDRLWRTISKLWNVLSACAQTLTTAKYFNSMTWHFAKEEGFFFEQISGSYGALSLSGECCRCAFVRRSYSIWTNTKWLSACCTVIILEVWCSLTVKKCSFPSINKLIKPLLGSITAYLSGNSEVAVVEMSHCKHKNKWFSSVAVLCL